ncbi:universal stress protein [Dokdonella fugitiva]|jgi:hypothetical protein|uniref:Universal stress protein family protein n=1 Tax=Dokdonella fugitiva TaxID=328517 RepID=A0A4R2ICC3_9GAMM|nr:universal stress protein [Dokdonella fugitiva]TCO40215.1 hypothetical protein EV148_1059 [Dokdonella fugitiva]
MRDIMVYAGRYDAWSCGVEYAASLASCIGGSLTGVFVHLWPFYMPPPTGSALEPFESASALERSARAAESAFIAWANGMGVQQVNWQVADGRTPESLAHVGNWHDLLVLDRDQDVPWGAPVDLGSIVVRSHVPCLMVPPARRNAAFDCIAIAWNDSPQAMRAIHSALPLLRRASRVILLDGARGAPESEAKWQPPLDIHAHLARHGIDPVVQGPFADGDRIGEALLLAASRAGADLLVMGAYGRSRIGEWHSAAPPAPCCTRLPSPCSCTTESFARMRRAASFRRFPNAVPSAPATAPHARGFPSGRA